MQLSIDLPSDTAALLQAESVRRGVSLEMLAAKTLAEHFVPISDPADIPAQEWVRSFREYIAAQRSRNPNVDDSRDSIYSDLDE